MNNFHCIPTCTSNGTPLLVGAKDNRGREFVTALRTKVKNDMDDYKKAELVAKERRWVGTIVTKMFDGERYMGNVVDFDEETEYFKVGIVYEDSDKQEEVCKEELRTLVPPPKLVCEYLDRIQARKNEIRKKRKRGATTESASAKRRLPSKSNQAQSKKVKCKKAGNNASQNCSTYVPLAFREKKKDAYIWYY
ncbi:hypothetical protein OWV82_000493 [Melia azedarach]|uniref:Uncharacterized protein n=1 Tax=Melia azedarach TaxID=155640 RepID=A0ACC1YUF6_MELAZ|nr:hypothetical protein OWV82_000493 [Melia azedarach]